MKKLFIILLALPCLMSFKESDRIIEKPIFGIRDFGMLEINKIILTDTATILHIEAFLNPYFVLNICSLTYLQGNGIKYQVSRSEGIDLDKKLDLKESGKIDFSLFFPPIDKSIKSIDFIESDCDNCFKMYDIDLTGNNLITDKPEGLPDEAVNSIPNLSVSMQEASLEVGTALINLHLLGYKKGMSFGKAKLYNVRFFPSGQEEIDAVIDENTGIATFEFEQYGITRNMIMAPGCMISVIISPGTMNIYIDLKEVGRQLSYYLETEESKRIAYFTDQNADVNRIINSDYRKYGINLNSDETLNDISGMSEDEYINYIALRYKKAYDIIFQATNLSNLEKDFLDNDNKMYVHYNILYGNHLLEKAYNHSVPAEKQSEVKFRTPQFTKEHFNVIKDYRIEGVKYLYTELFPYTYSIYFNRNVDLEIITGQKESFLHDLQKMVLISDKVGKMEDLTDKDKANIALTKNPFFSNAIYSFLEKNMNKK